MTCEQCRQQMLPYLYELLEPLEREELALHLETCAVCQEALKSAREQAGMMAEAVKAEADIVFKAPVKATPASTAQTLMMPRPKRRFVLLNRWAAAAAVLIAIFSAGGVFGWTVWRDNANSLTSAKSRLARARDDLSKSQQMLNENKGQTQREIRAIQEQIDTLFGNWKEEESKTRKVLEDKRSQTSINVYGPRNAVAGAKNSYEVELGQNRDLDKNVAQNPIGIAKKTMEKNKIDPTKAQPGVPNLQIRAVNQRTGEILYKQQLNMQQNGRANFDLPSDLPIKPNDDIAMEFQTETPHGKLIDVRDNLKLVFPEYVTHLTTDRPMYRPGETVRFRSLTLERFSLKPSGQEFHLRYRIVGPNNVEVYNKEFAGQLVNAKTNAPIKGPTGQPLFGLGAGEFALPADLPGGQYTLFVSEVNDRFREDKRVFIVQRLQAPRFNKEVTFNRSSYGPGDEIKITVRISPVQGMQAGFRNNINVNAVLVIDDGMHGNENRNTDNEGRVDFTFRLPAQMAKGVGKVTITCNDGASPETVVRMVPIVVRDLVIDFYPEGGDLVAGVPNRVYFQARTPAGKPADFEGVVLDDKQQVVARLQTVSDDAEPGVNQGLGTFTLTPQLKKRYTVRVDAPIGIDKRFPLPQVKDKGVVLNVPQGVVDNDIQLTIHNVKQPRELLIGAYCRGRMLDHKLVTVPANKPVTVALKPQEDVGGVYRITVFEKVRVGENSLYRPLAERLVYRKSAAKVDVAIQSDRKAYQPGETVQLDLQARNEKKEAVPAIMLLAVVDGSVLKLADEKTARTMPTHFLLTTEIRNPEDLEHADFLLTTHPKAAKSLDLLLGSQGWRRFAEQDPKKFQEIQRQTKPPVFLANANPVPQLLDAEQTQIDKLDQAFVTKAIDLQKKLADKEKNEQGRAELQNAIGMTQIAMDQSHNDIQAAQERLREIRAFLWQFGLGGALLTLLFIGFFLISVGLRRLAEGGNPRIWLFLGLALLSGLFLASVVGTFALMGVPFVDEFDIVPRGMKPAAPRMMAPVANPVPAPFAPLEFIEDDLVAADPAQLMVKEEVAKKDALAVKGPMAEPQQPGLMIGQEQKAPLWMQNDVAPMAQDRQAGGDRQLRQQGDYQTLLLRNLGRRVQLPPVHDPSVVREYAHQHEAANDNVRRDFTETIYWHPVLVLEDGKAQVQFDLSDSVTRYQVLALTHTLDGRLGANRFEITAKLPFSVEPKVPIEISQHDQVAIPVAVTNETPNTTSATLSARVAGLQLLDNAERGVKFDAGQSKRELFHVKPTIVEGNASFRVLGKTQKSGDAVERKFKVAADGFPVSGSISGIIENGQVEHEITLPEQWVAGTLQVQARFFPSPVAELQGGLEQMLREPAGCFEQSSSSNYPNVLILNYLKQQSGPDNLALQNNPGFRVNPVAEKRARQLLQSGYRQLTNFECADPGQANAKRGYEWFGAAPPHEALTAYGLLQFQDMAKIFAVDDDMLRRTEQYLLDQRDGKGGFKRNPKGLDRFGRAPDPITNAYIVWALTERGVKDDLDTELAALRDQAKLSKDPYFLALAGLSHLNRKKEAEGIALLRKVCEFQKGSGVVSGAATSITGSQGRDLDVETTSLATLGWMKAQRPWLIPEFNPNLQNALKWLGQQRQGAGGYGGTQATILALKAMLAHAEKSPRLAQAGEATIRLRDQPPIQPGVQVSKPGFLQNAAFMDIKLPDADRHVIARGTQEIITVSLHDLAGVAPGKNAVLLNVTGGNSLPYTLSWSYRTLKPANDPKAPVKLATKLSKAQANEGETVKLSAIVENISGKGQGMTVAILGLPGGLALPEDAEQLKALARLQSDGTKSGKISAWEVRGRDLVLYWRDLAPDAKIEVELDLICRLPGVYRGPASRAYLYYDAERKFWVEPLNVQILEMP